MVKIELGMMLGDTTIQAYSASNLCIAVLRAIELEFERLYWNANQQELKSPFGNTAQRYNINGLEIYAYSWSDEEQPYNFKWKDIEISWYKYLGRGTTCNKDLSLDDLNNLLEECLEHLNKSNIKEATKSDG